MGFDASNTAEQRKGEWILKLSKSKPGKHYYYNVRTGQCTWTRPAGFVPEVCIKGPSSNTNAVPSSSNASKPSKRRSDVSIDHDQKRAKTGQGNPSVEIASTSNAASQIESLPKKRKVNTTTQPSQVISKGNTVVDNASFHQAQGGKGQAQRQILSPKKRHRPNPSKDASINHSKNTDLMNTNILSKPSQPVHNGSASSTTVHKPSNVHQSNETASKSVSDALPKPYSKKAHRRRNKSNVKAQERLIELQESLEKQSKIASKDMCSSENSVKEAVVTKEIPLKDFCLSNASEKVETAIKDVLIQSSGRHFGPAQTRLHELQTNLKEAQKRNPGSGFAAPISDSDSNFYDIEPMEVECMESEVLCDIEELRHNEGNFDLDSRPVFMDVDMECDFVEPDPESIVFLVLDTNILLSHLNFTSKLLKCNLTGRGPAHLFIPWQVLQELDNLKDRGKPAIQPIARRAINFLHAKFLSKHPRVRGQKFSEATKNITSCADDNILYSCLQLKEQCYNVVLVSNDTNLRNKALVSDVNAVSKDQLEAQISEDKNDFTTNQPLYSDKTEDSVSAENKGLCGEVLTELQSLVTETFTEIVSKGMKDVYKHLWEKRTVIPPPWDHYQVLHCLSNHWLALCDDFIPTLMKEAIMKLSELLKTKSNCTNLSHLEECFELTEALLNGVTQKYSPVTGAAIIKVKTLRGKLSNKDNSSSYNNNNNNNPMTMPDLENDERSRLVFMCFEEAHNAALNICRAESLVDLDHVAQAKGMMEAVRKLVHLLNILLVMPIVTLTEDNPILNELISLIKGDSGITPMDVILFLQKDSYRSLIQNGLTQFTSFEMQLGQMLQGAM